MCPRGGRHKPRGGRGAFAPSNPPPPPPPPPPQVPPPTPPPTLKETLTYMVFEGEDTLSWFTHQESPGPVATDQRLICLFRIPVPGIALNDGTKFPEAALHVTKAGVHFVRGEPHHGIHTDTRGYVVVLGQLPCLEILPLRHGRGEGGGVRPEWFGSG